MTIGGRIGFWLSPKGSRVFDASRPHLFQKQRQAVTDPNTKKAGANPAFHVSDPIAGAISITTPIPHGLSQATFLSTL